MEQLWSSRLDAGPVDGLVDTTVELPVTGAGPVNGVRIAGELWLTDALRVGGKPIIGT